MKANLPEKQGVPAHVFKPAFLLVAPKARADEGDPPSRVARTSFLDGNVSFQPSGTEDLGCRGKRPAKHMSRNALLFPAKLAFILISPVLGRNS